jgi:hypothetical protein
MKSYNKNFESLSDKDKLIWLLLSEDNIILDNLARAKKTTDSITNNSILHLLYNNNNNNNNNNNSRSSGNDS